MSPIVIDASVAAAWIFDDEPHAGADAILAELESGDVDGFVTRHWHLEVRNALLVGERRGRITSEQTPARMSFLDGLGLQTDTEADLDAALDLARRYRLTMYDAVYLELTSRRRLAIATLDGQLRRAASSAGVGVLP